MMSAIHLPTNQPADRASDQNIRRKMPFSADARCTDGSSQPVNNHLGKRTWILVSYDTSDGPGHRRMIRRKRSPMFEKPSQPLSLVRAFSSKRIFESAVHHETIDRRFSSKNARFPVTIVTRKFAPQIESATRAHQRVKPVIRNTGVMVDPTRSCRKRGTNGPVSSERPGV